jgi:hypothetical protein
MAGRKLTSVFFCVSLLCVHSAYANPFGALYSWGETPDFAPHGLTSSPDIAKWLMTLPQPDNSASVSPERTAEADIAREMFDSEPIGSKPYHFTNPLESFSLAENTDPGGTAVEGRSVAPVSSGSTPHGLEAETCTCMAMRP